MRDDMRPTFKQVRDYFINKEAKPPITNEYMKTGYGQKRKGGYIGYIDFAEVCSSQGEYISKDEQHNKNYEVLKNCIEKNLFEEYELSYLRKMSDISILDLNLDDKCEPNQKWHLYVSLFAQTIIEIKNEGKTAEDLWITQFRKYPSLQLKLWMAEVVGLGVQEIGDAIKNNAGKSKVNNLIREISWDAIFEKVYSI
ncbi:hypothetical protein [Streptococcus sp. 27098_8_86]|uniref:hypothetical protein n=1 Tax=Streptococcus sp. 27098_8_86 TaxID=3003670 RepID=UPI00352E1B1E